MEEVKVVSHDGASSIAEIFRSSCENPKGVIVCLPAMGVPRKLYRPFAQKLSEAGFHVINFELRGIDSSSIRPGRNVDFGYAHFLKYDLPAYVELAGSTFDGLPLYLCGHSLGGQLSALYLSQHPKSAKGLILVAACLVHYKGWSFPKNLAILGGTHLAYQISKIVGHFPGRKLGFGGQEAVSVMRDWSFNGRTGRYKLSGCGIDYDQSLKDLDIPILAISIKGDIFAPPKAVDLLISKIGSKNSTHNNLMIAELQGSAHFGWIKSSEKVVEQINQWVSSH
ncbi:MAG: alpha/beta fold hydrolase [Bacteriovoracaceae bacterium]|jgi:predicted alpha/beta hydrolase|nr:alpha/beta fold hydrolase [Bacteriovoracaceae bacterium]